MADTPAMVEKRIILSPAQAERLHLLAQARQISEDAVIARALDILFSLEDDLSDESTERPDWYAMSAESLRRIWDNEYDAVYDNWEELYGLSPG